MDLSATVVQAESLIKIYSPGWRFRFDESRVRFGACHHLDKLITLSRRMVLDNPESEVITTVKHEIAHARAGFKAAHGYDWQVECLVLNIPPVRCYDSKTVVTRPLLTAVCDTCGQKFEAFKKPRTTMRCPRCKTILLYTRS